MFALILMLVTGRQYRSTGTDRDDHAFGGIEAAAGGHGF
jgi:hypothetical protein